MLDFALMLIDEYVGYPVGSANNAILPVNYCMIPEMVGEGPVKELIQKALSLIC